MDERKTGVGTLTPPDFATDWDATQFQIEQYLNTLSTVKLVKVVAVYGADKKTATNVVGAAGYLDVQPLVRQVDGANNSEPHGVIHDIPFMRVSAGDAGIVINPSVGDVGLMACCDRDSSGAVAANGEANPGSGRTFDAADGMYLFTVIGGKPKKFIHATDKGWKISPDGGTTSIELTEGKITIWADVVNIHGLSQLNYDVFGTGYALKPGLIKSYTDGVTDLPLPPNPPKIPEIEPG